MIAAIAWSLLLLVIGWPIAAALDRSPVVLHRRLAESYLLGAGVAALVLVLLSAVRIPWSRFSLLVPMIVMAIACGWIGRKGLTVRPLAKPGPAVLIDALSALLVAGYARFATIAPSIEFDFISIWGLKARELWMASGIDWRFLENPFNQFAHVDYPLLVPLVFDSHAVFAGGWPDRWLGVVNVGFGLATLLLLRSFLAGFVKTRALRAVCTLALVGAALSPWIGLAEGALVAYGVAGLLFVRHGLAEKLPGEVMRGGIYLGLAAMCKNEGLSLLLAAALAVVIASGLRMALRLWPAAAFVVPWLLVRGAHHLQNDLTASGMLPRVVEHLFHPKMMIEAMARYPVGRPLFWLAILLAAILCVRDVAGRERFLAAAIAIQLFCFFGAYLITPNDVTWQIQWSLERIVTQLAAISAFLAFALVVPRLELVVERYRSQPALQPPGTSE